MHLLALYPVKDFFYCASGGEKTAALAFNRAGRGNLCQFREILERDKRGALVVTARRALLNKAVLASASIRLRAECRGRRCARRRYRENSQSTELRRCLRSD
jgi:hypothetical protein